MLLFCLLIYILTLHLSPSQQALRLKICMHIQCGRLNKKTTLLQISFWLELVYLSDSET